jgi:hypothetical protein
VGKSQREGGQGGFLEFRQDHGRIQRFNGREESINMLIICQKRTMRENTAAQPALQL